jgi:biotin carboxyl carrier protein
MLPLQFVVAPDYGRFHPASLPSAANGSLTVASGALIGEVRNGAARLAIHSPFDGRLDAWLVTAGQIVIPGQPLCSLSPVVGGIPAGR